MNAVLEGGLIEMHLQEVTELQREFSAQRHCSRLLTRRQTRCVYQTHLAMSECDTTCDLA